MSPADTLDAPLDDTVAAAPGAPVTDDLAIDLALDGPIALPDDAAARDAIAPAGQAISPPATGAAPSAAPAAATATATATPRSAARAPAAAPAAAASPSPRLQRWAHYLDDLQAFAAMKVPLQAHGSLVRVTGLVLEAAGVRAPLGAICEIDPNNGPYIEKNIEELKTTGKVTLLWSCRSHKSIRPGDRAFFAKVGSTPRGIFASGTVVSEPFLSKHWSGENNDVPGVLIEFDVLLKGWAARCDQPARVHPGERGQRPDGGAGGGCRPGRC